MSLPPPYTIKAIRGEVRRAIRLYPRDQLDEAIVRYISDNFVPKLSPKKGLNMLCDKDLIIGLVCGYFKMSLEKMVVRTRLRTTVYPRQIMHYMLATKSTLSLMDIGRLFGQDHTTIGSSRNKIIEAYTKNPTVRADIDALIKQLPSEAQNEEE